MYGIGVGARGPGMGICLPAGRCRQVTKPPRRAGRFGRIASGTLAIIEVSRGRSLETSDAGEKWEQSAASRKHPPPGNFARVAWAVLSGMIRVVPAIGVLCLRVD